MSAAAKVAMAKGREKTMQARKAKKEAARKRAQVAREARTGKKAPAKSTPKKWMREVGGQPWWRVTIWLGLFFLVVIGLCGFHVLIRHKF